MAATRVNDVFLPGFPLPPNVVPGNSLESALGGADVVLGVIAVPRGAPALRAHPPAARTRGSHRQRHQGPRRRLAAPHFRSNPGNRRPQHPVAVLSGPTFAREVAAGSPTALVLASESAALATELQGLFSGPTFRVYASDDPAGVEIGGALKNVIAIAPASATACNSATTR